MSSPLRHLDKINQTQSTVCNTEENNNDAIAKTNNDAALEMDEKNSENNCPNYNNNDR